MCPALMDILGCDSRGRIHVRIGRLRRCADRSAPGSKFRTDTSLEGKFVRLQRQLHLPSEQDYLQKDTTLSMPSCSLFKLVIAVFEGLDSHPFVHTFSTENMLTRSGGIHEMFITNATEKAVHILLFSVKLGL